MDSSRSADAALPRELRLSTIDWWFAVAQQSPGQDANRKHTCPLALCLYDHASACLCGNFAVNQDLYLVAGAKAFRIMLNWALFIAILLVLPPLLLGVIRKTKASFQGRIGARFQQPLYDLIKML